jgi:hypothetical protein
MYFSHEDFYVYDAWGNLLQKNVIKGTAESMTLTVNNKNRPSRIIC